MDNLRDTLQKLLPILSESPHVEHAALRRRLAELDDAYLRSVFPPCLFADTDAEAVTIVAALRAWVAMGGTPEERYETVYGDAPSDGARLLDDDAIDELCERINTGEG